MTLQQKRRRRAKTVRDCEDECEAEHRAPCYSVAWLCVSLYADRACRDLQFQCFAACHALGRMVAALVWGAFCQYRIDDERRNEPRSRASLRRDRYRARNLGGHRARAFWPLPRAEPVLRNAFGAARIAGSDHGSLPASPLRGAGY